MQKLFDVGFNTLVVTEDGLNHLLKDMGNEGVKWKSGDLASEWSPSDWNELPLRLGIDASGLLYFELV